ncbi:ABC transporter ATP-binding protein [Streptomyces albiflavescens]|uniref:ABC transporter ATP-binding protein n=1 Tax=Streptomyces albiflavescens TaxID=1623582 RepID=UPI001669739A|nr:ABC transporter ATP-binding protein [Streptomyces albiflavescens]
MLAESGSWVGAALVAMILSPFYGIRVARRISRAWPGARDLDSADRMAVVRATRRGEDIGHARLAHAVLDYGSALRAARERDRLFPWMLLICVGLSVALALSDTFTGSTREAMVSWLVVAFFLVELTWWPSGQSHVMSNAERAETSAREVLRPNTPGE